MADLAKLANLKIITIKQHGSIFMTFRSDLSLLIISNLTFSIFLLRHIYLLKHDFLLFIEILNWFYSFTLLINFCELINFLRGLIPSLMILLKLNISWRRQELNSICCQEPKSYLVSFCMCKTRRIIII